MRVLAITRKPYSASFEQRILAFQEPLEALDVSVQVRMFPLDVREQRQIMRKAANYDLVWWHRHLLTRTMLARLRKHARRVVYDFDDPVFFSTREGGRSHTRRTRFSGMLSQVEAAMAASEYLRELAAPYCPQVHVVPMSIDVHDAPALRAAPNAKTELLWLGSKSTQKYLEEIRPALERLGQQRSDVTLRLVAHHALAFGDLAVHFVPWSPEAQAAALRECDIGLCPMPDTPWTRGKCPYKVLQYMEAGMPWVGSAVGENLVTAGADNTDARGLCAAQADAWFAALNRLIERPAERAAMGANGQHYVAANHDRAQVAAHIAQIFRQVHDAPHRAPPKTFSLAGLFRRRVP